MTSNKETNTVKDHEQDINNTIQVVKDWLYSNNLIINLQKSKYIQFNKSIGHHSSYNLNIHSIENVSQAKFLGVILDEKLDWKSHLDNITNRINKYVYALRQVSRITNVTTAISCYHAYVESVLRYGLILWGYSTESNRAFIAQKKCLRAIYRMRPDESCRPLFKKLGLLPFPSLYIYEVCMFVHKYKSMFKKACDTHPRACRDPDRLLPDDHSRLAKHKKSCLIMCVKVYNNIPAQLRSLNIMSFKKQLHRWLNNQNFYSLHEFFDT